ncbi:hypothetical protein BS50DRAFT_585294 [Corynespora cassiicola Philippines]|uniref:Large ribosomal subunit protein mL54 n=1 Tax=Corynespora cassiicola Philippines TaxID=1448308 RepID=A0A2T2NWW9_CORCC|nr:hypothetical protein BS50DRAFT_585294 [Corynespora cassiicola Philippines]
MICRTCLRAAARPIYTTPSSSSLSSTTTTTSPLRLFSTSLSARLAAPVSAASQPAARQGDAGAAHTPPAATSTSAAQPFSAPTTPSSSGAAAAAEKKAPIVRSSVPAGTPLKGLNFLKNQQDPVALADDEYPEWLWGILERQEKKAEAGAAGDLFSKSKKQRRLAAKRLRKEQLANPELLAPKIPVTEQTIDLPAGDGSLEGAVQAAHAREDLTKALRAKRRANIKEKNFLKAMG